MSWFKRQHRCETANITIIVYDKEGNKMASVEVTVSGTISPAAAPLSTSSTTFVLNGTVGVPIPETVLATVSGGVQPYSYAMDPKLGALPQGLSLDESAGPGVIGISGTPQVAGPVNFGVIATDASGATTQVGVGGATK